MATTSPRLKSHAKSPRRASKPKRQKVAKLPPTESPVAKLPQSKLPPLVVNIVDVDGECDRQIEFRDPRQYFCDHWQELNPDTTAVPCPEFTIDDDDNELARFAVVQLNPPRVVLRLAHKIEAQAFANGWGKRHGETVIVREYINIPTDRWLAEQALGHSLTTEELNALIDGMTKSVRNPTQVEAELPPLLVDVRRDGKLVRTIEVEDPRTVFCQAYNSMDPGDEATPVR